MAIAAARAAEAASLPLALPYNADIVREVGGSTTGGLGLGGEALVTQGYAAANDSGDPSGLPDAGVVMTPGGAVTLGSYAANNAVRLAPGQSVNMAFPAAQYERLDIYVVAADGSRLDFSTVPPSTVRDAVPVPLQMVLNHVVGTSLLSATVPNYLTDGGATPLIDGMDTTGPAGVGFADVDDAAVYHFSYALNGQFLSPLNEIRFVNNSPTTGARPDLYILAATLDTVVPEPSGLVVICAAAVALTRRWTRRARG